MQLTSLLPAALVPTAFSLVPSHMQLCPAAENRPRCPSYDSEASAPPPLPAPALGLSYRPLISFPKEREPARARLCAYLILRLVLNSLRVKSMSHSSSRIHIAGYAG